jgi:hypothetical protein
MRNRIAAQAAILLWAALQLSGCASGSQPQTAGPDYGKATLACVNALLNTSVAMPEIVVLKRSDFAARFGAEFDGYYVGREQRVYLSSRRDGTLLAHELAHHARVVSGGVIDEPEAENAAMQCRDGRGWRG